MILDEIVAKKEIRLKAIDKVKFKKLSIQYKDGLAYITEEILGDSNENRVRRAIKTIEKGV